MIKKPQVGKPIRVADTTSIVDETNRSSIHVENPPFSEQKYSRILLGEITEIVSAGAIYKFKEISINYEGTTRTEKDAGWVYDGESLPYLIEINRTSANIASHSVGDKVIIYEIAQSNSTIYICDSKLGATTGTVEPRNYSKVFHDAGQGLTDTTPIWTIADTLNCWLEYYIEYRLCYTGDTLPYWGDNDPHPTLRGPSYPTIFEGVLAFPTFTTGPDGDDVTKHLTWARICSDSDTPSVSVNQSLKLYLRIDTNGDLKFWFESSGSPAANPGVLYIFVRLTPHESGIATLQEIGTINNYTSLGETRNQHEAGTDTVDVGIWGNTKWRE